jgi:hypothetical protein
MACQSSALVRAAALRRRLELGEELFDGVQIGRVRRQVEDRGTGRGDRPADALDPVRREVVEHHDVARPERWRQELLHVGAERGAFASCEIVCASFDLPLGLPDWPFLKGLPTTFFSTIATAD